MFNFKHDGINSRFGMFVQQVFEVVVSEKKCDCDELLVLLNSLYFCSLFGIKSSKCGRVIENRSNLSLVALMTLFLYFRMGLQIG